MVTLTSLAQTWPARAIFWMVYHDGANTTATSAAVVVLVFLALLALVTFTIP